MAFCRRGVECYIADNSNVISWKLLCISASFWSVLLYECVAEFCIMDIISRWLHNALVVVCMLGSEYW